jgi:hypothetical protein
MASPSAITGTVSGHRARASSALPTATLVHRDLDEND